MLEVGVNLATLLMHSTAIKTCQLAYLFTGVFVLTSVPLVCQGVFVLASVSLVCRACGSNSCEMG